MQNKPIKKQKTKTFKARTVCFTINNPKFGLLQTMTHVKTKCDWVLAQEEIGKTGTHHFQGMAFNEHPSTWSLLKQYGAHIEATVKPLESVEYCQKEDTRIPGTEPVELGERPTWNIKGQKLKNKEIIATKNLKTLVDQERLDWKDLKKAVEFKNLYGTLDEPKDTEDVRGIWYVGEPGSGKSYEVRRKYKDIYNKKQNKWWCGYNGQKTVLLDDFDKSGKCLAHYIKIWADRYGCSGETKGGNINLHYDHLIVTSNYWPSEIWNEEEDNMLFKAIDRRFKCIWWEKKDRVKEPTIEEELHCSEIITEKEKSLEFNETDIDAYLNKSLFENFNNNLI